MFSFQRLARVASAGLRDLWPALQTAFNRDADDDRMHEVYGPSPRATAVGLALGCVVLGEWFARQGPDLPLAQYVNWPAAITAAVFALLVRRFLFAASGARPGDFPWLAASLAPAIAMAVIATTAGDAWLGAVGERVAPVEVPEAGWLGALLRLVTDALGLAAALVLALATLCFSRDWFDALVQLALRLFLFHLMIWITALLLLELDILSQVIGAVLRALTGWTLPDWLAELADVLGYAALLTTAYLAVIGGTWTVARRAFPQLLEHGQADILSALQELIQPADKTGTDQSGG